MGNQSLEIIQHVTSPSFEILVSMEISTGGIKRTHKIHSSDSDKEHVQSEEASQLVVANPNLRGGQSSRKIKEIQERLRNTSNLDSLRTLSLFYLVSYVITGFSDVSIF